MSLQFDAIVIGTGQSGPNIARTMAAKGIKIAIVERKQFGGTCVNTGCIPTKDDGCERVCRPHGAACRRIRRGCRGRRHGRHAAREGAQRQDFRRLAPRAGELAPTGNITVLQGHARFESPHEVRVGDELLAAERIFVNVGGRAVVPDMPGVGEIPYLTNSSMMNVDFLPKHLIVIGGSYIGLEFGQMFRRFGSEVTIIEMGPRLAQREDPDTSEAIREIFEKEGIALRLNAKCISFTRSGEDVVARVDCTQGAPEVAGSHVLLAVGPASEYRRSRSRQSGRRSGPPRVYRDRRSTAHHRPRHLGPSATAMAKARSRILRGTTPKS